MNLKRVSGWLALLLGVAAVYYLFLPAAYNFDGTVFAHYLRYAVVSGQLQPVIQLHHLLYFPLAVGAYQAVVRLFSIRPLEYHFLQGLSLLFGLASLAVVGALLRRRVADPFYAWAGTLAVAGCYSFWLMAVEAEVHMAGFFFVAAGMALLLNGDSPPARAALASGLIALGCGFHLTNGLAFLGGAAILLRRRERRLASLAAFSAGGLVGLAGMYGLAGWLGGGSLGPFLRRVLFGADAYAGYSISYWNPLSLRTIAAAGVSLKNALCGAGVWLPIGWGLFLLVLGVFLAGLGRASRTSRVFLLWLAPYLAFFSFWDPANIEFKLSILVPLLLGFTVAWDGLWPSGKGRFPLLLLITSLIVANLHFAIAPQSDVRGNANYRIAEAIAAGTKTDDLVVIAGIAPGYLHGKIYIPYFARRRVLILDWLLGRNHSPAVIAGEIGRELDRGRRVWFLDETVAEGEVRRRLLEQHRIEAGAYRALLDGFAFSSPHPLGEGRWMVLARPK